MEEEVKSTERLQRLRETVKLCIDVSGYIKSEVQTSDVVYSTTNGMIITSRSSDKFDIEKPLQFIKTNITEPHFVALTIARNSTIGIFKRYPNTYITYIEMNESVDGFPICKKIPIRMKGIKVPFLPEIKEKDRILILLRYPDGMTLFDFIKESDSELNNDKKEGSIKRSIGLKLNILTSTPSHNEITHLLRDFVKLSILPLLVEDPDTTGFDLIGGDIFEKMPHENILLALALASSVKIGMEEVVKSDIMRLIQATSNNAENYCASIITASCKMGALLITEEPGTLSLDESQYLERNRSLTKSQFFNEEKFRVVKSYIERLQKEYGVNVPGEPAKVGKKYIVTDELKKKKNSSSEEKKSSGATENKKKDSTKSISKEDKLLNELLTSDYN